MKDLPLKKTGRKNALVRMALLILAGAVLLSGNASAAYAAPSGAACTADFRADEAPGPCGQTVPDGFAFSGGTGKMRMLCSRVYFFCGRTYALLHLSSSKVPQVTYEGTVYAVRDQNVLLPLPVNETAKIHVLTTAMSTPHDVEYRIRILAAGERCVQDFSPEEITWFDPVGRQNLAAADPFNLILKDGKLRTADRKEEGTAGGAAEKDVSQKTPQTDGLAVESEMEFAYAEEIRIYRCQNGLRLIDIPKSARYLYVPEGERAPENLPEDITVLEGPVDAVYLAATSAMALIDAIGAADCVSMSGTSEGTWLIDAPKEALANGTMVYAGKYSEPDFETMLSRGCDLAVESTMILHTPKVKEMIEDLGIPVLIDYSSYEGNPLGRTEWVKLYGVLLGKEAEAEAFFEEQKKKLRSLEDAEKTGKSLAYFWITQQGTAVIRTRNDYIPAMVDLAGGEYIFDGAVDYPDTGSTMTISMEQFYAVASKADYLVYNATIDDALTGVADLVAKNAVFSEFKAVQEGNVWQIDKKAYQSTDKAAELILDLRNMLTNGDGKYTFLTHLS